MQKCCQDEKPTIIIDGINFPELVSDFFLVNPVDLEVLGPFDPIGMGSFQVCEGETFEFWVAGSSRASDVNNLMTTLQI